MENPLSGSAQPLPDHLHAPFLHAGFWRRVAAYLIDSLIMMPVFFILEFVFLLPVIVRASHDHSGPGPALFTWMVVVWLLMIVLPWLYFAFCESSRWQATPGKLALGLKVTDMQGRPIGFGRATGRFFGKLVSGLILDIGYMMAGWTARKQGLHDLMADCCVVRKDGLAAFERGEIDGNAAPVGTAMPGWAVALIVVGALFFMVIPVVAIMAAIAIPAYQNYLVRAQVAEGMALAAGAKVAVAEYTSNHGSVPVDNTAAGLSDPDTISGRYVRSVQVENGEVVVTFGDRANQAIAGEHLVFKPYGSRDDVRWRCGSPEIEVKYLPQACRDE
ncbi:MAG TPA: RDD family protein [Rhodanobacteraceae bacterium]|nr:RDD family protein [Rhodanobacteraceae bacterium]